MDHASTLSMSTYSIPYFYYSECDEDEWKQLNWKYIVEANYTKYQQFELARFHLFQTIDARIVEADPNETYWSIGLDISKFILCYLFLDFDRLVIATQCKVNSTSQLWSSNAVL